jgi:minichromosome maintenance protein 10
MGGDDGNDSDGDEETLQLQLKAIEARLKLKKLQKAKEAARAKAGSQGDDIRAQPSSQRTQRPERPRTPEPFDRRPSFAVQVTNSPKAQAYSPLPPESPRRVQLGIDKGLKAADVSLKRPRLPSGPGQTKANVPSARTTTVPAKSFSQRLTDARDDDVKREEKQKKQAQRRTAGFGVSASTGEEARDTTTASVARANAAEVDQEGHSGFALSRRNMSAETVTSALADKDIYDIPRLLKDIHSPDYDPPDGHESTGDYVLLAIVASKSQPRDRAATHLTTGADDDSNSSKFCVLKLTDLKWELDLFLFDTGFIRFRKLTVGTVIAILNPLIMPPKPHMRDSGQFSLKLGSSEDTVLEIGMAQHLQFCKSIKKDGQECNQWLDGRKTEFCDFHVNLAMSKQKASRAEISSMVGPSLFGGGGIGGRKRGDTGRERGRGRGRGGRGGKDDGFATEGHYYDREAHSAGFIVPRGRGITASLPAGGVLSAAKILDSEDYAHGASSSRAERHRKRLAEQEREREVAQKLATMGTGSLGGEYMKHRAAQGKKGPSLQDSPMPDEQTPDADSLGLIRRDAGTVNLDPVKGARKASSKAQEMGWGGAFQRGLLDQMRDQEKEDKKKAADSRSGAEVSQAMVAAASAPATAKKQGAKMDSSDDDLDIV